MNKSVSKKTDVGESIKKGVRFLVSLQEDSGCWKGDYGGPMFLAPMYICACYITEQEISEFEKKEFIRYFTNVQNDDGSIGLHVEDSGCMFTTVLSYVALRILGLDMNNSSIQKMHSWIIANGTALGSASWGKFFLCLLNLCPYEGITPLLPELWVLPYALPFHPGRLWCHARQVYLPMSYLYGVRAKITINKFIHEIRNEIYSSDYGSIDFQKNRDFISPSDNYRPQGLLLKFTNRLQRLYEKYHFPKFRNRSLSTVFDHILYEDLATNFIDIGPVNSVLNTLVHYFHDPESENFTKSFTALKSYLYKGHDGLKMNGYNSTALWDTVFSVQSIVSTPFVLEYKDCLRKAYDFIRENQVMEDVPDNKKYYRHTSRGGWPFSDREHGWPITDCTAEGYKSEALVREHLSIANPVPDALLVDSIKLILSFQNNDGGWATYEKKRGGNWLELLNPSGVFGDIMVDYSYVECTSSCIQALARARKKYKGDLGHRIDTALRRGAAFILSQQRLDGSFEGSWAVCFTYGTWFGVWGLLDAGISPDSISIKRACEFLARHQNDDGGWGEHFTSCKERRWVYHEKSQAVNTAWALMALIRAGRGGSLESHKAAQFLVDKQSINGDWPRESLVGVFNKTALINYENYRRYFPLWALGLYDEYTTMKAWPSVSRQ